MFSFLILSRKLLEGSGKNHAKTKAVLFAMGVKPRPTVNQIALLWLEKLTLLCRHAYMFVNISSQSRRWPREILTEHRATTRRSKAANASTKPMSTRWMSRRTFIYLLKPFALPPFPALTTDNELHIIFRIDTQTHIWICPTESLTVVSFYIELQAQYVAYTRCNIVTSPDYWCAIINKCSISFQCLDLNLPSFWLKCDYRAFTIVCIQRTFGE